MPALISGTLLDTYIRLGASPDTQLPERLTWRNYVRFAWGVYTGKFFDEFEFAKNSISRYKKDYDLYKYTKYLYNHAASAVDFYVGALYPGVVTTSGDTVITGVKTAFPLGIDTAPELRTAIGQIFEWANFHKMKSLIPRITAAVGTYLVEIIDQDNKIMWHGVFPDKLVQLVLDDAGNVKSYAVEYPVMDKVTNVQYMYRKYVDNNTITEYRDGDVITTTLHGYTFCPAVLFKHEDYGGYIGQSCFANILTAMDEMNSLLSHANDILHKMLESPMIFWTEGQVKVAIGSNKKPSTTNVNGQTDIDDFSGLSDKTSKEQLLVLKGPENGKVDTLVPRVELQHIFTSVDKLDNAIKTLKPEITFYKDLRQFSQISGIAVQRLVEDVVKKTEDIQANYDVQMKKIVQMSIAIAGNNLNEGIWQDVTPKQQKFQKFDLTSFNKDQLDFSIEIRPLVKPTADELANQRIVYWQGVEAAVQAGEDVADILRDDNMPEERIAKIVANREKNKPSPVGVDANVSIKPDKNTGAVAARVVPASQVTGIDQTQAAMNNQMQSNMDGSQANPLTSKQ